ncbi:MULTISPECIES: glycoside hydrolase family protein [unclassified Nocardioides]|uniref:glycoside hydrolase family 26 protein n=1 Tax=unclassified Nocardioides TaxID=2615069 RepID=UPI0000570D46|nr:MULTISPECIES: glycoside hydrolase family protein [unclassified Nocardioides]ABL81995.1 glycoside hydrolase, family 26 [Nocardioides sp. JS614]
MRPRAAVLALLAGLLTGGTIASGATPASARPAPVERTGTTLTARLAPPVVTVGEPSALVARATPVRAGRSFTLQRLVGTSWTVVDASIGNARGRAVVPLDTSVAGRQVLRVVAEATADLPRKVSSQLTLKVYTAASCTPRIALVDRAADPAARCLAARLDRWRSAGLMGVGQQLNVSNIDYLAPLTALAPRRVSVVGFDLEELAAGETYQFPAPPLDTLVTLAQQGAVLSASWHTTNPHTSRPAWDRSWTSLDALLSTTSPEGARFWADFDAKLALLQRFQEAGVAVVFRPFHEANGGWFWWGKPDPATYKRLWAMMQQRAWAAGVHNVVWAYSFAARTWSGIRAPERLLPARVDVAGIDSYDPEGPAADARDRLDLTGYAAVAEQVTRLALTEVGPESSAAGDWNPAVISRTARALTPRPVWAMLWFDDTAGKKQLSSLTGGVPWLDSCPNALCYLR